MHQVSENETAFAKTFFPREEEFHDSAAKEKGQRAWTQLLRQKCWFQAQVRASSLTHTSNQTLATQQHRDTLPKMSEDTVTWSSLGSSEKVWLHQMDSIQSKAEVWNSPSIVFLLESLVSTHDPGHHTYAARSNSSSCNWPQEKGLCEGTCIDYKHSPLKWHLSDATSRKIS